jgi:hypothetical protein
MAIHEVKETFTVYFKLKLLYDYFIYKISEDSHWKASFTSIAPDYIIINLWKWGGRGRDNTMKS